MEFSNLKLDENITFAEYIWIDGSGQELRSKCKTYYKKISQLSDLEWWTFDGSSCQQAVTGDSEIWLKPACFVKDPFRQNCNAILVLCETYIHDKVTPARYNFRYLATKVMEEAKSHDPWFGIEQEFFLTSKNGFLAPRPYQWPRDGFPTPQGQYYCGVGASNALGRDVLEAAYRSFLYAGLKISGINGEVAPSQWEYQVGITKGIEAGDHYWLARYIVKKVGEYYGVDMDFQPKPVKGDWNGSGCHTNFSTNSTREEGGYRYIIDHCMPKMDAKHKEHIAIYGDGNEQRLSGFHETSSIHKFSYGSRSRACSVRIPVGTELEGKGYYEDRRPASNMDAYLVTASIVDTVCLDSKYIKELISALEKAKENQF